MMFFYLKKYIEDNNSKQCQFMLATAFLTIDLWIISFIGMFVVAFFMGGYYASIAQGIMVKFIIIFLLNLFFGVLIEAFPYNWIKNIIVIGAFAFMFYMTYLVATSPAVKDISQYENNEYEVAIGVMEDVAFSDRRKYDSTQDIYKFTINGVKYNMDLFQLSESDYKKDFKGKEIEIHYLKNSKIVVDIYY